MSIFDQINSALASSTSSDDVQGLRGALAAEMTSLRSKLGIAQAAALAPSASDAEARQFRQSATEHAFALERLATADLSLAEQEEVLRDAESAAERAAEYEAARDERDALAADIAEQYPRVVATMLDLLDRLTASNARVHAVNTRGGQDRPAKLATAEDVARGPIKWNEPSLLTDVTLVAPKNYPWPAWPRTTTSTGVQVSKFTADIQAMLPSDGRTL